MLHSRSSNANESISHLLSPAGNWWIIQYSSGYLSIHVMMSYSGTSKAYAMTENLAGPWQRPAITTLAGRYVTIARLNPGADIDELYDASHRTEEFRALWRYLPKS